MPAVNQRIPNFLGGVSQQPDTIKFPGQVRVCDNAVPDVTFGLMKRPPGEFVKKLTNANADGYWYEILRDGDEKYLIQITAHADWKASTTYAVGDTVHNDNGKVYVCDQAGASAGSGGPTGTGSNITDNAARWDYDSTLSKWIRVWDLLTGVEQTLSNSSGDALFSYLSGATSPYSIQSIQDYTIITNPQQTVGTTGNTDTPLDSGDYSFVRLDTIAYNTEYVLYQGTAPTPKTYRRATALEVSWQGPETTPSAWAVSTFYNKGDFVTSNSSTYQCMREGTSIGAPWKVGISYSVNDKVSNDDGKVYNCTAAGTSASSGNGPTGTGTSIVDGSGTLRWDYTATTFADEDYLPTDDAAWELQEIPGGNTWDSADVKGGFTGLNQFSFSDSACENLEGHVTVNAASYVHTNDPQYQSASGNNPPVKSTGNSGGFIGYSQNYRIRYTAQVTLKDGGLIKVETDNAALAKVHDIIIEGQKYQIKVSAVENSETYQDVAGIAFYKTPRNPDEGSLNMLTILNGLNSGMSNVSNVTSTLFGNGLYLSGSNAPKVNFLGGAVNEQMTVIGTTAQNVSKLPSQCKHGYIVQIANDSDLDSDNYYVKFIADNFDGSNATTAGGTGKWEECVRPHNFAGTDAAEAMVLGLDPATMPHALINNRDGTFTFKKLDSASSGTTDNYWKDRDVGDNDTNPFPSFNGLEIQKIFFHRNRLGLIANEQVVLSRPGDYFNFFIVSAITTSDDNPVDITVSDIKPAFINHTLPIQKGLMLFSDNGQFILFTESDIFSPKTARLKKISSYECDASLQPRDMGTSVMFTSSVSAYTRAFEATVLDDDVPPQVLEQTRVVPEYIPKDVTMTANSASLGIVTFGKKNSSELYHYKYFDSGQKRDQSAWYSWTLTGTLQHMLYSAGSFYVVTKHGSDYVLCRHEYVTDATAARSYTVGGNEANVGSPLYTARWFEACLDCMDVPTSITYTAQTTTAPEKTVLALNYTPTAATNFYAVGLNGTNAGMVVKADSVTTNSATFNGINMTGWEVVVGYAYTSTVELPDYHLALEANKFDTDGSLRISGINFDLGVSGPMEFHLTAKNSYVDSAGTVTKEFDDYIQYESGMKTGLANFGEPPSELNKSIRVPIQKKNTKYNLQIKIPDPFSTALISASWDGNYNQRRHVRR